MNRLGFSQDEVFACRLLVVDDVPVNCELIASYLELAGFSAIETAADGVEALEKIGEFGPDLLLLDLSMPRMDGYEVCRRLRADATNSDLPILVETALDEPGQRAAAFKAGATDLVTKPINRDELIARVRIHLERRLLIGKLLRYHDRLEGELATARQMQAAMLPSRKRIGRIEEEYGLRISAHFEPSDELGGDFWGMRRLSRNRLGVFVVDFTGHGVTAAMNTFRLQSLMGDRWDHADNPAAFLEVLNAALVPLLPSNQFATMLYAVVDVAEGQLTFSAAAATDPFLGRNGSCDLVRGDGQGLPLGISLNASYDNRSLAFAPGNLLFLYSDALLDPSESDTETLTEERLARTVGCAFAAADQRSPLAAIIDDYRSRNQDGPSDDVTAILLESIRG